MQLLFLFSALVVAACGLVYELIAGTLASYLLGDSVTQFSTVIGVYLFAMGLGSFLSRYVKNDPLPLFVKIEILIGLVGGFSAPLLFTIFAYGTAFRLSLYGIVISIGTLVGLEIPLLMQILKEKIEFRDLVAKVLTFDYIGALFVSLLFPLFFVPSFGLIRTSLFFGAFNVVVALITVFLFENQFRRLKVLKIPGVLALLSLITAFIYADSITAHTEAALYPGEIIYSKSSPYQRIIVTGARDELRLYLNGHLQFSSRDEYRYHESLVHPGMQGINNPTNVLVLGGGDGFAVRELLKYDSVNKITLVDLDRSVSDLFRSETLSALNKNSLNSTKVEVVNMDAFLWLEKAESKYDFIVIDFPDPTNFSVGKLYTGTFYKRLNAVLADDANFVVQTTSPLIARKSFWCIASTIEAAGFKILPYHAYIPSFGEWGFVLAGKKLPEPKFENLPTELKYISAETFKEQMNFSKDMQRVETEINRLDNQILVQYYEEEWEPYEQFS